MLLSFDVDAESAFTGNDPDHADRLITMSYGGYEARVGTPKLLQLLDQLGLKATFFITGWTLEAHPAMCEAILMAGHEVGHHGYHHRLPDPGDPLLVEEVDRGFEALKRVLGVAPKGYRAPSGEFSEELRVSSLGARHRLHRARSATTFAPIGIGCATAVAGRDRIARHGLLRRLDPRPLDADQPAPNPDRTGRAVDLDR